MPKGKPLPPYAIEYFNQLVAQYLTLTEVEKQRNLQAKELAEALIRHQDQDVLRRGLLGSLEGIFGRRRRRKEGHLNWGVLNAMEMCILRLIPDACLEHLKCSLNARYHDLAGQDWFDMPQLSRTSAPLGTGQVPTEADYLDLRANLSMMLADIQRRRALILARETQRNDTTWVGAIGAILTVIGSLLLGIVSQRQPFPTALQHLLPICFVLLSGASGGLVSMLRRLQGKPQGTDQTRDTIIMGAGQSSLLLSPLYGAIFASVLYLIFRGRMLNALIGDASASANSPLFPNFPAVGLLAPSEFAKLMVWSFAAGFAEKFVPDVLDRITARSPVASSPPTANSVNSLSTSRQN